MRALITADFHLTSRPADEYRWGVFPWLRRLVKKHRADHVLILGDLTDRKDEHDSVLVNRLVSELLQLKKLARVTLLKGNHDYGADPATPFFGFLDGTGLPYYRAPAQVTLADGERVFFLPHVRNPAEEWPAPKHLKDCTVFFHAAVKGAVYETGRPATDGVDPDYFKHALLAVGGDVHAPQWVGDRVVYAGAPHPVHYGDEYQPRALLLAGGKVLSIKSKDAPRKLVRGLLGSDRFERLARADLRPGDMVRLTVQLPRSEFCDWPRHRKVILEVAARLGITLGGLALTEDKEGQPAPAAKGTARLRPAALLERWAKRQRLDPRVTAAGKEILESLT